MAAVSMPAIWRGSRSPNSAQKPAAIRLRCTAFRKTGRRSISQSSLPPLRDMSRSATLNEAEVHDGLLEHGIRHGAAFRRGRVRMKWAAVSFPVEERARPVRPTMKQMHATEPMLSLSSISLP